MQEAIRAIKTACPKWSWCPGLYGSLFYLWSWRNHKWRCRNFNDALVKMAFLMRKQAPIVAPSIWWTDVCVCAKVLMLQVFTMWESWVTPINTLRHFTVRFVMLDSAQKIRCCCAKDKKTYQMDYANREAIKKHCLMLKKVLIWLW
jgi:hypothetical protein